MFASLPNETIVEILSHLPPESVAACQLVCRRIHEVFKEASYARYKNALSASNGIDNQSSPLTPQEKFDRLRRAEKAWAFLTPTFSSCARVKTAASGLYDLTGDSYVVGNSLKTALHCLSLPSKKTDELKWREIDLGNPCVDFGLSVYENDLLAVVSSGSQEEEKEFTIDLRQFSTGEPHPEALQHTLTVPSKLRRASVWIETSGDTLILILTGKGRRLDNTINIFNWKTGMLKAQWSSPPQTYVGGVVFLTTRIFLLPNGERNSLDIFTIPEDLTLEPLNPIAIFHLPRLKGDFHTYISCRAEPNPRLPTNLPHDTTKPFYDSSKGAIILFQYNPSYVFFVHRSAFLDLLSSKNLPRSNSRDLEPTSLTWEEWGPKSTRFISSKNVDMTWITTTAGERALLFPNRSTPAPAHRTVPYVVLDFNKERVRKMRNWISRTEGELGEFPYLPPEGVSDVPVPEEEKARAQKRETLNRVWVVEGEDTELTEGFEESVTSLLPYFACTATSNADNHWWNGAIMDNERVIGMGNNGGGRSVGIHCFNPGL